MPESVKVEVTAAVERALDIDKDVEGSTATVTRAMVACRKWEGEDPDVILPYPHR